MTSTVVKTFFNQSFSGIRSSILQPISILQQKAATPSPLLRESASKTNKKQGQQRLGWWRLHQDIPKHAKGRQNSSRHLQIRVSCELLNHQTSTRKTCPERSGESCVKHQCFENLLAISNYQHQCFKLSQ